MLTSFTTYQAVLASKLFGSGALLTHSVGLKRRMLTVITLQNPFQPHGAICLDGLDDRTEQLGRATGKYDERGTRHDRNYGPS